ncbi:dephospho-CoA kinase [Mycoplasmopsis phocirhinis]|uniref:Dephospho-CoA kinase n=1 Tax=Mycoplasmopsis phocirhinis TaxID=142650 RepID=A0A4P6MNZ4_9BACT|nr:dephospho-CoA kinase [Mycoplasmopsis phocirhinis]QBF34793.1 dephospho-CoA kinase [Mycoplasmopsis phocirhinis]
MIAVIGKIGVGKTTFLKNSGLDLNKVFFADKFIENEYQKKGIIFEQIKSKIGIFLIENEQVSKKRIRLWLNENNTNIDKLEKIIFPVIFDELKNGNYAFVELPVLFNKNINFLPLFSAVLCLSTSEKKRQKNLFKRNVNKLTIKALDAKNSPKIAKISLFSKITIVDIYGENFLSTEQNKKNINLVQAII